MRNPVTKIILFILIVFIIVNNLFFIPHNIFSWDVFGYYLYLPLKFIYHDLGVSDLSVIDTIVAKYHNTTSYYQLVKLSNGGYAMKYSMGLSIFYGPFFFPFLGQEMSQAG